MPAPEKSRGVLVIGLGLAMVLAVGVAAVAWQPGLLGLGEELPDAGVIDDEGPVADDPVEPPPLTAAVVGEPPHRPNLILITVDTVRADHLSTYGYPRDTSPALTRRAEHGVIFTRAYSSSSWTSPSIASILSGVIPSQHGVLNATFRLGGSVTVDPLPDGVPSLPRALSAAGYRTVGITANERLVASHGYGAGFDRYECLGFRNIDVLEPAVMAATGDLVSGEQPFFLWVHVLDPHAPYTPASGDRSRFWSGEPRPQLDTIVPEALALVLRRPPTPDDVEYLMANYDDELRYAFDFVDRVIDAVDDEPYVAIVTSDHGEEFGDHGGMGHARTVFDELVHVPFVVISPGYLTRTEAATPISSVDVLPTMVELAGAPPIEGIAGTSLVPVLRGEALPPRDIVLESGANNHRVRGLIRDELKYGILLAPAEIERLYDLRADPRERTDLMSERTEIAREMRARLEAAVAAAEAARPAATGPAPTLSPEELERLRELGYAGSDGPPGEVPPPEAPAP